MFEKLKANIMFDILLKRKDINKAYAMVGPEDSWYDTITTVHNSLVAIQKLPRKELELISRDGLKLKAVYYPGNTNKTMIWVHGYQNEQEVLEAVTQQLFKHIETTRFIAPCIRTQRRKRSEIHTPQAAINPPKRRFFLCGI